MYQQGFALGLPKFRVFSVQNQQISLRVLSKRFYGAYFSQPILACRVPGQERWAFDMQVTVFDTGHLDLTAHGIATNTNNKRMGPIPLGIRARRFHGLLS